MLYLNRECDEFRISKYYFLHKVLRHSPNLINLKLDEHGWVRTEKLLQRANDARYNITKPGLIRYVGETNKYIFSDNKYEKVRAAYGHTLGLKLNELYGLPVNPLNLLYHGTSSKNIESILSQGLNKMSRDHVFMTTDIKSAMKYALVKGDNICIVIIDGIKMYHECNNTYVAHDNTWLTDYVFPDHICKIIRITL